MGRKSEYEEASKQLLQHATLTRGATPGVDRSELDLFRCNKSQRSAEVAQGWVGGWGGGGGDDAHSVRPGYIDYKIVLLAAECPNTKDRLTIRVNREELTEFQSSYMVAFKMLCNINKRYC